MLEVKLRDATVRSGTYTGDGWKLPIPNILFPESHRMDAPGYAGGVLKESGGNNGLLMEIGGVSISLPSYSGVPNGYDLKGYELPNFTIKDNIAVIRASITDDEMIGIREKADIFILEGAVELYQNPFRFVETMLRIREGIGYQNILYLPGVAMPHNIGILFYLGADLLDATRVVFLTRKKMFLRSDGAVPHEDVDEGECACRGCDLDASANDRLREHNFLALQTELQQIRGKLAKRGLRQFIEYRAKTSPELVAMLRLMDKRYPEFEEKRSPVIGPEFQATTRLSLERPDVKRFRERVLTRYWKPSEQDILLILPCSARKPYSKSKSHQKFREVISNSKVGHRVHELIITSPLGLVPRELELTYPAQHYDIPVTGHWYEDEKKMINVLLKEYLAINKYDHIIVHFGDDDIFDDQEYLDGAISTAGDRPTDAQSLVDLRDALDNIPLLDSKPDWKRRTLEEVTNMARFQWGEDATDIFHGCHVKGRYPILKIRKGNQQLAMVSEASGFLIPTLDLAKLMVEKNLYTVKMHDFDLIGNLFAVGVEEADPRIRVGDEICIIGQDGSLRGAGTAKMNADEMVQSVKGEAVRVRHKVKK